MPKCRPQCYGPHLALLILAVFTLLVTSREGGLAFSAPGKARKSPKQATASVMRERSGLGIGERVTDAKSWRAVSPEESALAGKLKAGKNGPWKFGDFTRTRCCYAGCVPVQTFFGSRDVHKVAHCERC